MNIDGAILAAGDHHVQTIGYGHTGDRSRVTAQHCQWPGTSVSTSPSSAQLPDNGRGVGAATDQVTAPTVHGDTGHGASVPDTAPNLPPPGHLPQPDTVVPGAAIHHHLGVKLQTL